MVWPKRKRKKQTEDKEEGERGELCLWRSGISLRRMTCALCELTSGNRQAQEVSAAAAAQSCPTLCDPIDGSLPGSAVPGILQAGTLEWVAIAFSNARQ